ncbi:MAG: polyprenyl synthetase family protein [Halanaerobiales bacterium]|nr:polyprenyl synthetase family protein [Halanaerobiales bacterium]
MFWEEYPSFADELNNFENYFNEKLSSSNDLITQEMNRLVAAGGKRVRPALLIAVSHLGDFNKERIWPMAAAIEMIHLATLIHDDVIDKSSKRRGVETTHQKFSNKTAIFMGDFLFARSMEIILDEFGNEKIDEALLRQMKNTIKSIKLLCEGEVSQYQRQNKKIPTFKEYLEAIKRKTALLFKASTMLGADLSGMNKYKVYKMGKLGYYMGMSFQLVDDIFDFQEQNNKLGKPQNNDFTQGIYTLPIIYIYGESENQKQLDRYLEKPEKYSEEIKRIVHQKGGIEYTKQLAFRYKDKAQKIIDSYKDNKYGEIIYWLTEKIIDRNF